MRNEVAMSTAGEVARRPCASIFQSLPPNGREEYGAGEKSAERVTAERSSG